MFAMSFRLSRRKIAFFLVVCLTVVSGIFLLTRDKTAVVGGVEPTAKSVHASLTAKNNEQRVVFLQSFGWEIETEPLEVAEVALPEEMDDVLREYNGIQLQQNMDLEKYSGKRVKRYTYVVVNHPSGESDVRANVLVYRNKIIGGDICTVHLDGFMHGFEMGDTQANTVTYEEIEQPVSVTEEIILEDEIVSNDSLAEENLYDENEMSLEELVDIVE